LNEVEELLSGNTVYRTYRHPLSLESDERMAVQAQSPRLFRESGAPQTADCHVKVLSVTTRQRGKGLKRPQFDYTYAFQAVN